MRIQPISANQPINFYANPKPERLLRDTIKSLPKRDAVQERNYLQAIMVGLVFFAVSLTKSFIDIFKTDEAKSAVVEAPAIKPTEFTNTNPFQFQ